MLSAAAFEATPPPPRRIRLLGGEVDLVTAEEVMDFIAARVACGRGGIVANHNLHSLHLQRRSAGMRRFYELADLIEVDSTPMIAWGKLLGLPISRIHRCTYLDWREAFWTRAAANGWRVFYLGGAPGVAAKGAQSIRARHPQASIAVRDGYFDAAPGSLENQAVVEEIARYETQVLLVGMGMPRQEQWILHNAEHLARYVVLPVGAAFDYEAGAVPTPPRWMGPVGLEWAFRFATEPRRLFTRYFVEPWSLIPAAGYDLRRALLGL